jgi:hypothetical protein
VQFTELGALLRMLMNAAQQQEQWWRMELRTIVRVLAQTDPYMGGRTMC